MSTTMTAPPPPTSSPHCDPCGAHSPTTQVRLKTTLHHRTCIFHLNQDILRTVDKPPPLCLVLDVEPAPVLSPGVRGCRCLLLDVRGVVTLSPSNDTKGAETIPVVLGGVPHLVIYVTYWGRPSTAQRTYAQFQVGLRRIRICNYYCTLGHEKRGSKQDTFTEKGEKRGSFHIHACYELIDMLCFDIHIVSRQACYASTGYPWLSA